MAIWTISKKLNVSPYAAPLVIQIKQYTSDFALKLQLYSTVGDLDIPAGATTKIRGTKRDGNGYELAGTRIGHTCTFSGTKEQMQQMTAAHGRCVFEVVVEHDGKELITANFYLEVQRAAMDAGTVTSESIINEFADFQSKITAAQAAATAAQASAEAAAESAASIDFSLDSLPTQDSTNAVSSGGVYDALLDNGLAVPLEWIVGKRIGITNDVAGNPASNAAWRCIKTNCAEGDTFIISATTDSANNYRAWAFVRDDNTVISKCASVQSVDKQIITAPAETSYLLCNDKNSGSVCYGGKFIGDVLNGLSESAFKNQNSIGNTSYTSLNDIIENSVYQVQANSVSDMPVNASITVITNLFGGSGSFRNQIAIKWDTGDIYYRYLSSGTWSTWKQHIYGYSESVLTSSDDLNAQTGKSIAIVKSGASNLPANYPAFFGTNGGVFVTFQTDTDLMQVGVENKKGITATRTKTGSSWGDWTIYTLSACASLADNSDADDRYGFILDGIQVNKTIANYPKLKADGKTIAGSLLTIPTYGGTIRQQVVLPFYTDATTQENREELGVYMRRLQSSTITPWNYFKMVPRNRNAKYIAFGDSTTWGYSADHDHAQSPWNYPAMVGDLLGMRVSNLADPAQGMIKDWSVGTSGNFAVIPTINEMITNGDFDDVKLITVGWAYNDADFYSTLDFGNPTDAVPESTEGITTWLGYYCKILDILQRAAPQALVILITGFGYTKSTAGHKTDEQFSKVRTFRDGGKTMKQMYDGLEEMANYNGYCCINQAKGCAITRANGSTIIGDSIHPTYDNYRIYGDNISSRIVSLFNNRIIQ